MPRHPLAHVDANLLIVLDSLLETSSVAETARQLGMSASAVSHALARVRDLVNDPILVRAGQRMVVTARARAMAPALRAGLAQIAQAVVKPIRFNPATHTGVIRLASVDFATNNLLPPFIHRVRRDAPQVDILVSAFDPRSIDALAVNVDLAIALHREVGLPSVRLAQETFVCVVRQDHPVCTAGLDLAAYAALPHVLISPAGAAVGAVDALLAANGLSRRVALVVPTFLAAVRAVVDCDLVLTGSRREAERAARILPVQLLEPPLSLPPFEVGVFWHSRTEHDPLVCWTREQLCAEWQGR